MSDKDVDDKARSASAKDDVKQANANDDRQAPASSEGEKQGKEQGNEFAPEAKMDVDIREDELQDDEVRMMEERHHNNLHFPRNIDLRHDVQKLFVNNLPKNANEESLTKLFSQHGKVISAVIPQTVSKQKACYAIVEMENHRQADDAMRLLSGHELDGSRITITPAMNQDEFPGPSS